MSSNTPVPYIDDRVQYFDTVADVPDTVLADSLVTTQGYFSPGDNGGNAYRVVDGTLSEDGGFTILLGTGKYLVAIDQTVGNFLQWGIKPDDNSGPVVAANDTQLELLLQNADDILVPAIGNQDTTYYFSKGVSKSTIKLRIRGAGRDWPTLDFSAMTTGTAINLGAVNPAQTDYVDISDIRLIGPGTNPDDNDNFYPVDGIVMLNADQNSLNRVRVTAFRSGVKLINTTIISILDCVVAGNKWGIDIDSTTGDVSTFNNSLAISGGQCTANEYGIRLAQNAAVVNISGFTIQSSTAAHVYVDGAAGIKTLNINQCWMETSAGVISPPSDWKPAILIDGAVFGGAIRDNLLGLCSWGIYASDGAQCRNLNIGRNAVTGQQDGAVYMGDATVDCIIEPQTDDAGGLLFPTDNGTRNIVGTPIARERADAPSGLVNSEARLWQSDGSQHGNSGDLQVTARSGGNTREITLGKFNPQRNYLTRTEETDTFTGNNAIITDLFGNATYPDPFGTLKTVRLNSSNALASWANITGSISAGFWTLSVWAKVWEQPAGVFASLQLVSGEGTDFANFDLQNGVLGNYDNTASGVVPVIEDWGNGWYRCGATFRNALPLNGSPIINCYATIAPVTDGRAPVSDSGSGPFLFGPQVEPGKVMTDYFGVSTGYAEGSLDLQDEGYDRGDPLPGKSAIYQLDNELLAKITDNSGNTVRTNLLAKSTEAVQYFETVADVPNNLVSGTTVTTQGYNTAFDGGANSYRFSGEDENPVARPVLDGEGGFTIKLPGANAYLDAINEGPIVNVKQFGAFGDGTTDDSDAIILAAAAAAELTNINAPDGNIVYDQPTLYFPPSTNNQGYRTTKTITVDKGIHVKMDDHIRFDSATAQKALVIGTASDRNHNCDIDVEVIRTGLLGTPNIDNDVGIEIINPYYCNIHFRGVYRFTTGTRIRATNSFGALYNTVFLGTLRTAHIQLDLVADTVGSGCNETLILGGRFNGIIPINNEAFAVRMSNVQGSIAASDNTRFVKPSFEMNPSAGLKAYCFLVQDTTGLEVDTARSENNNAGEQLAARFTDTSTNNYLEFAAGGTGGFTYEDLSENKDNYVYSNKQRWINLGSTIFSTRDLGKRANYYDGDTLTYVPDCCTAAITDTGVSKAYGAIPFDADGVKPGQSRGIGRVVDTSVAKKFVLDWQADVPLTLWVMCFDADGNIIDPTSGNHAAFPGVFISNNLYRGSPSTVCKPITLSDTVQSAAFFLSGVDPADKGIQAFSIRCLDELNQNATTSPGYTERHPGMGLATTPPTAGDYEEGRVIYNDLAGNGDYSGWVARNDNNFDPFGKIGESNNFEAFAGTGIALGNTGSPHVGASVDFEVEARIRISGEQNSSIRTIWSQWDSNAGSIYLAIHSSNKLQMQLQGFVQKLGNVTISPGVWYKVKVTRTGNDFQLYVDDVADGTAYTGAASIVQVGNDIAQAPGGSEPFYGDIDYVKVISNSVETYNGDFTSPFSESTSIDDGSGASVTAAENVVINTPLTNGLVLPGGPEPNLEVTSLLEGLVKWDQTRKVLMIYNGTVWQDIATV